MATETTTISTTPMPMAPEQLLKGDLVPYGEAGPDKRLRIEKCIAELEMDDANSIIFFGAKAQKQLTTISDSMLEGVKNKDTGPAGNALNSMVTVLRGFDVEGLDPRLEPSWIEKIFGWGKPVAKFLQRYEEVRDQIERIEDELDRHVNRLMTDIASLDRLYDANLDYFHVLADYIAAGEEMLTRADQQMIPELHKQAEATGDVLKAQELRDLRSARDDLERRVHDLRLTRQVAMQSLPSIRLVQENDKSLLTKINSTMANTVPLWRQQLAQAVTIHRSNQASKTLRNATDLTNELLTANAENLKQANAEIRKEVERGVFDIEVVKNANRMLIDTIEESLQIADEGKRKRADAERELRACETELRNVLAAARSRHQTPPPVPPTA
ncbi:MAG: toxic anion resistance protein [Rhizobiales bacterium]|nr:toxic anion resistance protein [Hyphomicrobiales bacterium]